jgi:putative membrane-bound dehydrogenase-like protein
MQKLFFFIILFFFFSCKQKQQIIQGFELQDGFNMELIASEPLIKDPVDLKFDDKGNMMVLEMPGYPFEDVASKVLLLKDTNHDGKMDLAKTYAENLNMATSFLPYKNGILVASPPYLLYCIDENKDEHIERVDTLMGGFSTGNLQHNYNGLTYGIDNWIYAANGGNDGKPYWWGDSLNGIDLREQDFRFNIDMKKIERIGKSSGGFGLAMDEFGRIFGTHNLTHASQIIFSDRYINDKKLLVDHTLNNISDHEENGLSRVYPIGEQANRLNHPEQSGYFSGSCGIQYYDGGSWSKKYDNTLWVNDVVLNLVHVDKLSSNQSALKVSRLFNKKEFLATSDRSSRPVNLQVGPDGNMYLVDMYREVIEHPEWIPDEMEKTLNINAGKDKGRIYRIFPNSNSLRIDKTSFENENKCIEYISHKNAWYRKTAERMLIQKGVSTGGINKLKNIVVSNQTLPSLHALWILEILNKMDVNILQNALKNSSAGIRENALIIGENHFNQKEIIERMITLLADTNSRVSMQAALSISTIPKEKIIPYSSSILKAIKKSSKYEKDKWHTAALSLAVQYFPLETFRIILHEKGNTHLLSSIALQLNDSASAIESMLTEMNNIRLVDSKRLIILEQLNKGEKKLYSKTIASTLLATSSNEVSLIAEMQKLADRFGIPPSSEFLALGKEAIKKTTDPSLNENERLQQMSIIELLPYHQKSSTLFTCIKNNQPLPIQEKALLQLSKYRKKEIGIKVIAMWNELSPSTKRFASDLLLYIDIHHDALLTALENGKIKIGEMNFDLERRRMLIAWTEDEKIKSRAKKLFSDEEITSRKDAITKMKPALYLKGNVQEGKIVFLNICSNCHKYGDMGKEVGPVLTEINRKSKESIMHDILDPNAAVNTQYISHRIETKNGTVFVGIIDVENNRSITLKKMGGDKITIPKDHIKQMKSMGTSLMMEGLEGSMSHQQMANLLAFLQKQSSK